MSAEVETNPEEEVKETKKPMIKITKSLRSYIVLSLLVLKIVELFICIICMAIIYEPIQVASLGRTRMDHVGIMYTALTGYIVINGVHLLSRLIGDRIPYRTVSLFAGMGSALFLVTGILLTIDRNLLHKQYYPPHGHLLVMLTIAIVMIFLNAILFAADAVFNFVMYVS